MDITTEIRKLAKSSYWQELYYASQNHSGVYLFKNQTNFSGLQIYFLYWLKIYSLLYTELAEQEWQNLDEKVIEDNIRCDWFLTYRAEHLKKKLKEYKKETNKPVQKKGLPIWKGKGK